MAERIFTIDKFLGLNESGDGSTELKLGEASKIENFYITDSYNLQSRPGAKIMAPKPEGSDRIAAVWSGYIGKNMYLVVVGAADDDTRMIVNIYRHENGKYVLILKDNITDINMQFPVKFLTMNEMLYVIVFHIDIDDMQSPAIHCAWEEDAPDCNNFVYDSTGLNLYSPKLYTSCDPVSGCGEALEPFNIIEGSGYLEYSSDGETKVFRLPEFVTGIIRIYVDNEELNYLKYQFDSEEKTLSFDDIPAKGVNNVNIFVYTDNRYASLRRKFIEMRHVEAYNGTNDNRLFFYGDGSNIAFYTGVPAFGSGLYIPVGNEIAVDASAAPITGMCRNGAILMAYKPDSTFSIAYEPVTLPDGTVKAGFYVRPVHKTIGNEMDGQIQTVNNYPRTLSAGSLYEWRNTSSHYRDERYAKRISEKIAVSLRNAAAEEIVTCDHDTDKTYYMFLNDEKGTVLVNRYDLDVWTMYTGEVFTNIRHAFAYQDTMLFGTDQCLYSFDRSALFDDPVGDNKEGLPILCTWESGYMSFGAAWKLKHSSNLWISVMPEGNSHLEVTVKTDKRQDYVVKTAGRPLLDFSSLDFSNFSFLRICSPKIQRLRLKVKKFVYYKLIFRITRENSRATVLGVDQQVRFSSNVK